MLRVVYVALFTVTTIALALSRAQGASPKPDSSASASPSPTPFHLEIGGPSLYVIATGGDVGTNGKLAVALADELSRFSDISDYFIVPEPAWSPSDFVQQCVQFPTTTDGALILSVASSAPSQVNGFFENRAWLWIGGNLLFASCQPAPKAEGLSLPQPQQQRSRHWRSRGLGWLPNAVTPKPMPTSTPYARIEWTTPVTFGKQTTSTFNGLSALAVVLTAASAFEAFVPSKTSTTVTTRVFNTSSPPPTGTVGTIQTNNGSTTNAATLGTISTALLAQGVSSQGTTQAVQPVDELTWSAAYNIVDNILGGINKNCPEVQPSSAPGPKTEPIYPLSRGVTPTSQPSPKPTSGSAVPARVFSSDFAQCVRSIKY